MGNLNLTLGLLLLGAAIFGIAYHYNKRLLDWLRFQSLGTRDYVFEKLTMMYVDIPPHRILIGMFAISFGMGSVVFLAFLPKVIPGIMFGMLTTVAGWKAPRPIVDWLYNRRVEKFNFQMVDALNLMSNGMKSGLSVVQSVSLVVQEMPNPVHQEFSLVLNENKVGSSLEDALNNMAKRIKSDDIEMFVTAINILKETGGNLAETFDTISNTIRERLKVQKKIQAMISRGFQQGMILLCIPGVLGVTIYQQDPELMAPMFNTTLGWALVMVIIILEVVAFFVIIKVVKIDV